MKTVYTEYVKQYSEKTRDTLELHEDHFQENVEQEY